MRLPPRSPSRLLALAALVAPLLALAAPAPAREQGTDARPAGVAFPELSSPDPRARELAALAAGVLGEAAQAQGRKLLELKQDREPGVRAAAGWARVRTMRATEGWFDEALPKGMQRAAAEGVYLHDTGKGLVIEMVYVPGAGYVGRTETTWGQYRAFCRSRGTTPHSPSFAVTDEHPVNISWEEAEEFCKWAGLVLPPEKLWEKAARGDDGREHPWGPLWDGSKCNHGNSGPDASDGFVNSAPVGSYPQGASPCGALDMAGNVGEWCADWYDSSAQDHVSRGGSWFSGAGFCRATSRGKHKPGYRHDNVGFRPARVTTE